MYIYIYIYKQTKQNTYIYIYIHTHTCIHTCRRPGPGGPTSAAWPAGRPPPPVLYIHTYVHTYMERWGGGAAASCAHFSAQLHSVELA